MLKKSLSLIGGSVLGLTLTTQAFSADLYVVHGINGTDLGLDDEALAVDISVNGECPLTGVPFRTISDALPFDPGQYDLEIRLSDGSCTGLLAVSASVDVQLGENASIIAHLTEQGTPTLTKFVNDIRPTDNGDARAIIRHTASAPPVDVRLKKGRDVVKLRDIRNSEQRAGDVSADQYDVTITPFGEHSVGPIELGLEPSSANIVYAVGSLKNGTLELISQSLPAGP